MCHLYHHSADLLLLHLAVDNLTDFHECVGVYIAAVQSAAEPEQQLGWAVMHPKPVQRLLKTEANRFQHFTKWFLIRHSCSVHCDFNAHKMTKI